MPVTLRWNTLHCYNPSCQQIPLYRCQHYHKCGHEGCAEHLPLMQTGDGKMRLCGECRLLRAIFLDEVHLIGLSTEDMQTE
jgi:hypothetical protein